jgi:hypothetical protein
MTSIPSICVMPGLGDFLIREKVDLLLIKMPWGLGDFLIREKVDLLLIKMPWGLGDFLIQEKAWGFFVVVLEQCQTLWCGYMGYHTRSMEYK